MIFFEAPTATNHASLVKIYLISFSFFCIPGYAPATPYCASLVNGYFISFSLLGCDLGEICRCELHYVRCETVLDIKKKRIKICFIAHILLSLCR